MKNTFYRPKKINCKEMNEIVGKLESDFNEILSGNVSEEEATEYVRKLIEQGEPLEYKPGMVFWGLDKPVNMPADARVDYLYRPTYFAVGIMGKALSLYSSVGELDNFYETLLHGLNACTGRGFLGSGYNEMDSFFEALTIFAKSGIAKMTLENMDYSPLFTAQLKEAVKFLNSHLLTGKRVDPWTGKDYIKEASAVAELLRR